MALLFCDSVRHYTSLSNMLNKWTTSSGGGVAYSATNGRSDGPSIRLGSGPSAEYIVKTFSSNEVTLIVGFRFKTEAETNDNRKFLSFLDGGTIQCTLGINNGGAIVAMNQSDTPLGSASVNALSTYTIYYIEVKVTINATTGSMEVRVNGTNSGWLNLTGIDTQNTANSYTNGIRFYNPYGGYRYLSDIYCCDTSGSYNNDFLGEVNIDAYMPNGAGNYSQWTPSAGDNYACVDDSDPSATDYVSSSTPGNIDTYTFSDLSGTNPQIKAVVNNIWAKKSNSGTIYIKSKYRNSGVDYAGSNITVTTDYDSFQHIYEVDPATSSAWTATNFNSAEFGAELSSS